MPKGIKLIILVISYIGLILTLTFGIIFDIKHMIPSPLFLILCILFTIANVKKGEAIKEVSESDQLKSEIKEKIDKISIFLKNLVKENEIELRERIEIDEDSPFLTVEDYINFLLNSLVEFIEWIIERSEKLSIFSAQINHYTLSSQKKSEEQIHYANEIIDLVRHLLDSFQSIVDDSKKAFNIADEAQTTYQEGNEIMNQTVSTVMELGNFINYTTRYLQDVDNFTNEMRQVLKIIIDMSQKTHMLSLNASIEAARAGQAGKGFKIVASEIQKFSQGTTDASKRITSNLKQLKKEMGKSFKMVEQSKETVNQVIEYTNTLKEYFGTLSGLTTKSVDSTRQINSIAQKELNEIKAIDDKIGNIQTTISDFTGQFGFLAKSAEDVIHSAEDIAKIVNNFKMNNYQTYIKQCLTEFSNKIVNLFEEKVKSNFLTTADVFDTNYQDIEGTNPVKYQTKYVDIIAPQLQEILEELKEKLAKKAEQYNKVFLACGINDRNGYIPTHLKLYSQDLTGNYDHDIVYSRHKRMYTDPVTLKSGRNPSGFLLQVYLREDGTQNMDLSMPIKILGKQWGGLRAGYTHMKE